jgi:hypothetical protein
MEPNRRCPINNLWHGEINVNAGCAVTAANLSVAC